MCFMSKSGIDILYETYVVLAKHEDWTAESIDACLSKVADTHCVGFGKVAMPLRVAITGGTISPPIGISLELLGKERTLRRVANVLCSFLMESLQYIFRDEIAEYEKTGTIDLTSGTDLI